MAQITYKQIPSYENPVAVQNHLGVITLFGDTFAWSIFLEGAARQRTFGIDVVVYDTDGKCLVGDIGQLVG